MNKPSASQAGRRRRIPAIAKRGKRLYRRTQERVASCGARRILAVLRDSGPRKRNVLAGLADGDAGVVDALVLVGLVRKRGNRRSRKSAVYEATPCS